MHTERFRPTIGLGGGVGEGGTVTFGVSRVEAVAEPGVSILVAGERAGRGAPERLPDGHLPLCIGRLKHGQVQDCAPASCTARRASRAHCVNGPCGDVEIEL